MSENIFKDFNDWLFDSNLKSEIPKKGVLLKYNSPITHKYLMKLFMRVPMLTCYLNYLFNNDRVWYIEREEFFRFIKKCVIDFKVRRNSIMYYPKQPNDILFEEIKNKIPILKNDDISLICNRIEEFGCKEEIFTELGLDIPKKQKLSKKKSQEKKIGSGLAMNDFINKNFNIITV